jgi:hypothetical protein
MICFVNRTSHLKENNETLLQILKKDYFCFVKFSPHKICKKLIAGLLLALLVFIYAEKTFHIHELPASKTLQTVIISVINNPVCNICDFTVAKDADLPDPFSVYIPLKFLIKEYVSASIAYHFQPENSTSNRGPPLF